MKKTKKHLLLVMLMLCIALSVIFAFSSSATESSATGMTFSSNVSDKWSVRKHLEDAPYTFETWIKVPTDVDTSSNSSRIGSIFSNYDGGSTNTYYDTEQKVVSNNAISFEVHSNGVPRLYYGYKNAQNVLKANDLKFSNVNVVTGEWVHLAIVLDVEGGDVICYLNGEEAQRITGKAYQYDTENMLQRFAFGQENRNSGIIEFLGSIRSLALYRDARTASDIKDAYENGVNLSDPNVILCYNTPSQPTGNYIEDISGNGYYVALPTYTSSVASHNTTGQNAVLEVGTGSLGEGPVADPVTPEEDNGFSFSTSDNYDMKKAIEPNGAMTFEVVTTLPTDTSAHNWIIGNWEKWSIPDKALGIQFASNRTVQVFVALGGSSSNSSRYNFTLPAINETDPLYRKLTLTFSMDGYITLYVDGVQVGNSQKISLGDSPETFYNQVRAFRLGGDYRANNTSALKDVKVKSIAMYKGVPADGTADTADLEAMFSYNLTNTSVNGYFADISGKSNDAIDKNKYDESLKYDYSFAIIGDTQYMTRWDAIQKDGVQSTTQHLKEVYDWLLANKDKKNIQYVMGLGDITDSLNKNYTSVSSAGYASDTAAEWRIAYEQISRLNGQMTYSLVRGNHDNSYFFNQYFNANFYTSQFRDPDYPNDNSVCFYSESDITNAYTKFEVGSEKYLLLLLDDKPTDAVVEWANSVISRNADWRVIINTHTYLGYTGELVDSSNPDWQYATGNTNIANGDVRNDGKELWDNLISKHANIVLVLCGHDYKTGGDIVRTVRIGENGNAVNEMLICPQSLDGDKAKDVKSGMVAMLYFSNNGKDIRVEYISTALSNDTEDGSDVYQNATNNNININLMTLPLVTEYGSIYPEYVDVELYPFAVFTESGEFLGGFDSFLDTTSAYNNGGAIYAAKKYLGANVWNSDTKSYGETPKSVTIVLRRDYAMANIERYDNIAHIEGTVTLELGGNILTVNDSQSMFPTSIKALNDVTDFETRFDIKNGSIKLGAKPLIAFAVSSNNDLTAKSYVHSFTNVKFIASTNTTNVLAEYSSSYASNPDIIFNDCTFDLTNAPSGVTLFNLGNGYINTNVTVNGGEFISNSADFIMSSKTEKTTSKLVFGKSENYTAITVPKGNELPITSVNDGNLVFVKVSQTETTETYRLRPTALLDVEFTPKMSITLYSQIAINVYIPANSLQKFTFNDKKYEDLEELSTTTVDGNEYYIVSVSLPSDKGAKVLTLEATVAVGENTATAKFTFSIPKYAEKVLFSTTATSIEKQLVKDVLAYVQSAYNYFAEFNTADEIARVNKLVNELLLIGGAYNGVPTAIGTTVTVSPVTGVTLNLEAKPTIRFYISDTSVEFFADGKKLSTVTGMDQTYGAYVELDVYAYALAQNITYGEGGSYHISDFLTKSEGEDHETLVACFVKYVESAAAYRNSVIGE